MTNKALITLAFELYGQGVPKGHIAQKLGKNRETIRLWLAGVEKHGLLEFLELYEKTKKGSREKRQIDPMIKRWIWDIREREMDCCGEKIQYFLQKEHGISPASSKIYEVLAEKYKLRTKWKKNQQRGPIPEASSPREVIQMDTVDFGDIYAITGIDIFTREADVFLAPELTARYGMSFWRKAWTEDLIVMFI